MGCAGAFIPWGEWSRNLHHSHFRGEGNFFLVHSTLAQFLSLHRKRRNVCMMKVLCRPIRNISSFPPGKAKFHVLKITSYPNPHRKAKLACTKMYFSPSPGKAKFHVPKLVLPPGKAKFHVLKITSSPLERLNFMYQN